MRLRKSGGLFNPQLHAPRTERHALKLSTPADALQLSMHLGSIEAKNALSVPAFGSVYYNLSIICQLSVVSQLALQTTVTGSGENHDAGHHGSGLLPS